MNQASLSAFIWLVAEAAKKKDAGLNPEPFLLRITKAGFYNTCPMDLRQLLGDQDHIRQNLYQYARARAATTGFGRRPAYDTEGTDFRAARNQT